jgi:hypothetical protein
VLPSNIYFWFIQEIWSRDIELISLFYCPELACRATFRAVRNKTIWYVGHCGVSRRVKWRWNSRVLAVSFAYRRFLIDQVSWEVAFAEEKESERDRQMHGWNKEKVIIATGAYTWTRSPTPMKANCCSSTGPSHYTMHHRHLALRALSLARSLRGWERKETKVTG